MRPLGHHLTIRVRPVRLILVLLLLATGAVPALADRESEVRSQVARLERQLAALRGEGRTLDAEAQRLDDELIRVRAESIVAARSAQQHEAAVARLEGQLARLADDRTAKTAALAARRSAMADTLGALTRLALRPPEAMLAMPGDANDAVRGGLLLRAAVPRLEARADRLRRDLAALNALTREIATRRAELVAAGDELAAEQARLRGLADRKAELKAEVEGRRGAIDDRIARMVGEARDLGDLMRRLEADRIERDRAARARETREREAAAQAAAEPPAVAPAPAETPPEAPPEVAALAPDAPLLPEEAAPFSSARGGLIPPVRGQLVRGYGEATGYGQTTKGMTLETLPGAQVVAPYDGRIAFVGPFRDFGLILIIEHGEGYHSLIAGMAGSSAAVGQWVLAGEPLGTTVDGGMDRDATASTIYVELRRGGQPIDPLPWFPSGTDKVSG